MARVSAFDWSLRKLAARGRSEWELRSGLRQAGYEAEEVDEAVARCAEYGYVDDEVFAGEWVRQRRAVKHVSLQRLRQELSRKGIPGPMQDRVLESLDDDACHIQSLLEGRFRRVAGLPVDKQKRLLVSFLARRGYGFSQSVPAVDAFLSDNSDSNGNA